MQHGIWWFLCVNILIIVETLNRTSSGGGHGDKCSKDSDCKSNYCHPKKGTCDCPVSGMKGDDCSICDRDHPTRYDLKIN